MIVERFEDGGVAELIHGVTVIDPYRWLEDRTDPATRAWIQNQQGAFEQYFQKLGSLGGLTSRVRELLDVEAVDQVGKVSDRYFYRKHTSGKQQPSIYVRDVSEDTDRLLIDPSVLGLYANVGIHQVSIDGRLLAYELKDGGEQSKSIHIVDVDSGVILADHIDRGISRGFAFDPSNAGFYYCHDLLGSSGPEAEAHGIRFHRLGTSATEDPILFSVPRRQLSKLVLRSSGGMLGAVLCHEKDGLPVVDFYHARADRSGVWTQVFKNIPAPIGPLFYQDRVFVHHYKRAPNGEIAELNLSNGRVKAVVVPEWRSPMQQVNIAGGCFYVKYSVGTESVIRVWSVDGDYIGNLQLDEAATWDLFGAYSNYEDEVFLRAESFAKPPTVFLCPTSSNKLEVWAPTGAVPPKVSPIITRITYCSKDKTEIAMSLIGTKKQGQKQPCPVVMTAYGGFGVPMSPQFSVFVTVMLELGFICAVPEIRGGGEKGLQWAEAARSRKRQNAFDDFIAGATWLRDNGIADPKKFCTFGACNGGLLVGAVVTQCPSLFRAALCIAPLLDMIRYEKFDRARLWNHEYGKTDDAEDFHALYTYSPYHRVEQDVDYPAMLFVTGDKDTRANPAHTLKMVARMQERSAQRHTILLDYSEQRGHSPAMPISIRVEAIAHRVAFLCSELGLPFTPGEDDGNETRR